jgi:hypothetical protein
MFGVGRGYRPGSKSTRTPLARSSATLRAKAGCLMSAMLAVGTATTGTASQRVRDPSRPLVDGVEGGRRHHQRIRRREHVRILGTLVLASDRMPSELLQP